MHYGTTAVLGSRARDRAFKSTALAPLGQADVCPEKLAGRGMV